MDAGPGMDTNRHPKLGTLLIQAIAYPLVGVEAGVGN